VESLSIKGSQGLSARYSVIGFILLVVIPSLALYYLPLLLLLSPIQLCLLEMNIKLNIPYSPCLINIPASLLRLEFKNVR